MTVFNLLSLLGGLALFLYGMKIMGEMLEKRAGSQLKVILEKLTNNPYKGYLLGLGVTSIIQSSSATTVMVVGFVNSGVMALRQAITVIMGANVGTTVTAWVLSLTAIRGESMLLKLLRPSSFTPVLAAIGIVLYLFAKTNKRKDVGGVLLGFAVLMYGMEGMSGAVSPLSKSPEFRNLMLLFSNPIFGVAIGTLMTAVTQSSSASVGILQALSATGTVTGATAVPIIMGLNIGTCVTAMLSSIGATKNAKRAAVAHLLFNVIGTLFWLPVFYAADAVFRFGFVADSVNQVDIAIIHTAFKVLDTLLLFPFRIQLEKLSCLLVPDNGTPEQVQLLDERLLATPAVAIQRCMDVMENMAQISRDTLFKSISALFDYREKDAQEILDGEAKTDQYEDNLGTYLVKLSTKSMTGTDSRQVSKLLHLIGDFERIGDHAVNILESVQEMADKRASFSPAAQRELSIMADAIREITDLSLSVFRNDDALLARRVEPLEQVVDDLCNILKMRHVQRLKRGECTIELGFVFADLLGNFERVSDHCSNIAICIIEMEHKSLDAHEYVRTLTHENGEEFKQTYHEYQRKYMSLLNDGEE